MSFRAKKNKNFERCYEVGTSSSKYLEEGYI